MSVIIRSPKAADEKIEQSLNMSSCVGRAEIRLKGKNVLVPSVDIAGRTVIASGKLVKTAIVRDEDLAEGEIVSDPQSFIPALKRSKFKADLFTFVQKLPDTTPKYPYHREWDNLAVIPITTFSDWWDKRADPGVRRAVRKAAKSGVSVREVEYSDSFVQGIVGINNETPIRQGKPFWHFQKSFEDVKAENATYSERNLFLGAYCQDELIGYIRMTRVDNCVNIIQILSLMKHYDKRPANALIAKAVEVCEQKGISHLVYCNYIYNDPNSSLTEFKRRNGFEKVLVPRYYVPLTLMGRIALSLGLHRGLAQRLPKPILLQLLKARGLWHARRLKVAEVTV